MFRGGRRHLRLRNVSVAAGSAILRDKPLSHALIRRSSNFHRALSSSALRLEVASLEISMPLTSFTLSWISPRTFMR